MAIRYAYRRSTPAAVESSGSVTSWLRQLHSRNDDASIKLWNRYFEQLARLAIRKLGHKPLRVVDADDVTNQVFEDLLLGIEEGRFKRLNNREDLWQIMIMLTERRAIDERRRYSRQKRGEGVVRGESVLAAGSDKHEAGLDRLPTLTDEFTAEVRDTLQFMLDTLPTDSHRSTAILKFKGYTNKETAEMLGLAVPTIERRVRQIKEVWQSVETE